MGEKNWLTKVNQLRLTGLNMALVASTAALNGESVALSGERNDRATNYKREKEK
jgi:hypothetical protein